MTTLRRLLARAAVAACAVAPVAPGQVTGEPLALDGIATDITADRFLELRPDARPLGWALADQQSIFYVYFPTGLAWSGYRIDTLGRGFEAGRGCAVGIGFSPLAEVDAGALVQAIGDRFPDRAGARTDTVGNRWFFMASSDYHVSAMIPGSDAPGAVRPLSVVLSLKRCDADLAARRWQTRPR